jgi:predicted amino acid-binding ACT domain protein
MGAGVTTILAEFSANIHDKSDAVKATVES